MTINGRPAPQSEESVGRAAAAQDFSARTDDATVAAAGKLSEALEIVEHARGLLYGFHRLCGSAESSPLNLTVRTPDRRPPQSASNCTERPSMTTAPHDKDHDVETPESSGGSTSDTADRVGHDPRATSHPTGEKQAAENAENEPAG